MSVVVALWAGLSLAMFALIVRRYSSLLRRGKLGEDWDATCVFLFGVLMGVIWPLTVIWLVARTPTRAERREIRQTEFAKTVAKAEQQARALGIGEDT